MKIITINLPEKYLSAIQKKRGYKKSFIRFFIKRIRNVPIARR
ncbi:MAG: hypothetical protein ACTSRI_07975 [Promethearchaeota archaeon]